MAPCGLGVAVFVVGMSFRSQQTLVDLNERHRIKSDHLYAHFTEALEQALA